MERGTWWCGIYLVTAAAAPKEGDGEKMGKGDERRKTGVKEGGKEVLTAPKKYIYFKHYSESKQYVRTYIQS